MNIADRILYEDNHILVVNKLSGELSQGDKTQDLSLPDYLKKYLKQKYHKRGTPTRSANEWRNGICQNIKSTLTTKCYA
jgi:23S rRNA-/tRNA-specific pseudouridylate synthase